MYITIKSVIINNNLKISHDQFPSEIFIVIAIHAEAKKRDKATLKTDTYRNV